MTPEHADILAGTPAAAIESPDVVAEAPADWDERTVEVPGGHVYQSVAWARHRARRGFAARYLAWPDGPGVLALVRPWAVLPGSGAYLPRGPVSAGGAADSVAARLVAASVRLAADGVDVVASDAEIPVAEGAYGAAIRAAGFRPIEELQPSRHRVALPLAGADETAIFGGIAKSTRQRIRRAEKDGVRVVRHDGRVPAAWVGEGFAPPGEPSAIALDRFYDLLLETGERLHFTFGPRDEFVAWWQAALRAGHLVHLEARSPDDRPMAGLLLYRHGERLSTVHSGDHADARREHPGALHLLRWRAIQLAIREGRDEMDLGGADVAGARREPREGEPMWGLYQHKLSFGGRWLELTGAHEWVTRPTRYLAARVTGRLTRLLGRGRR